MLIISIIIEKKKKKKRSQLIMTLAVDESKGHEFEFIIKKKRNKCLNFICTKY